MSRDRVRLAGSDSEIDACFSVMSQLRPECDPKTFVARVRRQQWEGYRLAMLVNDDHVVAVAGYRLGECLAWGKYLYVDDLVTAAVARSGGYGGLMMDWLIRAAEDAGCAQLHLDSGVQRFEAHRFYLRHGMTIASHHFKLEL